eukprot:UN00523
MLNQLVKLIEKGLEPTEHMWTTISKILAFNFMIPELAILDRSCLAFLKWVPSRYYENISESLGKLCTVESKQYDKRYKNNSKQNSQCNKKEDSQDRERDKKSNKHRGITVINEKLLNLDKIFSYPNHNSIICEPSSFNNR